MKKSILSILAFVVSMFLIAACTPTTAIVPSSPTPNLPTPTVIAQTALPPTALPPTATSQPVLTVAACQYMEDCPDAVWVFDLLPDPSVQQAIYSIDVPYDRPVFYYFNWVAKDRTALRQNMDKMQFHFTIDGIDYWDDSFMGSPGSYYLKDEPDAEYAAQGAGVVVSGWKIGQSHMIRFGCTIKDQINDGWDYYQSGRVMQDIFIMNPVPADTQASTPTVRTPISFAQGTLPAATLDQIFYMQMNPKKMVPAVPKNSNDRFLVVFVSIPSGTEVFQEDLDWVLVDEANNEYTPAGLGTPLQIESEPQSPNLILLLGKLASSSVIYNSDSKDTSFVLIFVVPESFTKLTLQDPQENIHDVSLMDSIKLISDQIPSVTLNSNSLEDLDGSENWVIKP